MEQLKPTKIVLFSSSVKSNFVSVSEDPESPKSSSFLRYFFRELKPFLHIFFFFSILNQLTRLSFAYVVDSFNFYASYTLVLRARSDKT